MKRYLPAVLLVALLVAAPLFAKDADTAAPKAEPKITGRFDETHGQRILTLWGTPRERGFAHGYLMAERILEGLEHDLGGVLRPMLPLYKTLVKNVVVPRFKFSADETAELEGLMEGIKARLPKEKLTLAALGREVDLTDLKALNTFGDWYGLGCSSVAVWGELTKDGQPLVGRNFDFPGFELIIGQQVVVVRAPSKDARGQAGVTYPGCIGTVTGMNADGVFVAIHDVRVKPPLPKALRGNVPRLIAVRRLLEQSSGAGACSQARDFVREWPTLYGNNLMVVAPTLAQGTPCAAVLEYDCRDDIDGGCSMRCIDEVGEGEIPATCLACTNHHRSRPEPPAIKGPVFPRWRYEVLSRLGGKDKPANPFDVDSMFGWMTKAAFPREGKPQKRAESIRGAMRHHGTLHQAVGEPGKKRLHVKIGAIGKHISEIAAHPYDVPSLVQAAAARQAVVTKPREPAGSTK